jgi:hypothetical protein
MLYFRQRTLYQSADEKIPSSMGWEAQERRSFVPNLLETIKAGNVCLLIKDLIGH